MIQLAKDHRYNLHGSPISNINCRQVYITESVKKIPMRLQSYLCL